MPFSSSDGIEYEFPASTRAAAGEIFVLARDPVAFRRVHGDVGRVLGPYRGALNNDGETLRVKDAGPGHPATVDFLRYGDRGEWPTEADGLGYSIELTDVTPTRDNDLGRYWRRSTAIGGSPGTVEGVTPEQILFRRGDVNSDGRIDQSDAIFLLSFLFLRGQTPECLDGSDADGNGRLNIADAIFLLHHAFLGGRDIPAPGTECGPARDGSALTCEASPPCEPN